MATGDGATLTFAHTMAHLTPTPYSVQIFVNRTQLPATLAMEQPEQSMVQRDRVER